MKNNPRNINLYVRYDLKTPTVNIQWKEKNGKHKSKSFGGAHFVEAWLMAFSHYNKMMEKDRIEEINKNIIKHTHIEHDLIPVPEHLL